MGCAAPLNEAKYQLKYFVFFLKLNYHCRRRPMRRLTQDIEDILNIRMYEAKEVGVVATSREYFGQAVKIVTFRKGPAT